MAHTPTTLASIQQRLRHDSLGDEEYVALTHQLDELLPAEAHYRTSSDMPDDQPPY